MISTSMRRPSPSLRLLIAVVIGTTACAGRNVGDLSSADADSALRSSSAFTTRPGSPVGRELIEVVAVRRIGNSSTEVEFTWRDTVPAAGQTTAPQRTSMALFRLRERGVWELSSLYKVN